MLFIQVKVPYPEGRITLIPTIHFKYKTPTYGAHYMLEFEWLRFCYIAGWL